MNIEKRNKKIKEYLWLVRRVASRMMADFPPNVEYLDLVSYGVFGLIDALKKYEKKKNVKFEVYASIRIRGSILDELRRMDFVPRQVRKFRRVMKQLEKENSIVPDALIAKKMQMTVSHVRKVRSWYEREVHNSVVESLDLEVDDGDNEKKLVEKNHLSLWQVQKNQYELVTENEKVKIIDQMLTRLPEQSEMVLRMYYFKDLTLVQIGKLYGVSESRVCQIKQIALNKLKKLLNGYSGSL